MYNCILIKKYIQCKEHYSLDLFVGSQMVIEILYLYEKMATFSEIL